ncbi:MAG: TMEM143 family protein [Planctomycetes bacterium]|nr:TMEM143 family protein [Planctomycetota bacterium]
MPRFVPCRTAHLAHELALHFEPGDRAGFWELVRVVEDLYHHYASVEGRLVEALYAPFDPDAETVPPASALEASVARLQDRLGLLLARANFERVPADVLVTRSDREVLARLKIDPDLDALEDLAIFVRGRGHKAVTLRPVRKFFRLEEREVPTYRRVALLVRTRRDPHVTLRLFKDVPCQDLELLVPTVRVKMRLLDKLKLSGSSGAAAVSAWKLLRALYGYAPGMAKLLAVPFQALLLPVAVLITGIYGSKTLLDYAKIRASYINALAEHLYAITMASNGPVVARLATMAGEEDTKEVLLAFAVLARAPGPLTPEELRQRAEALLWDRYRARVQFDVADAVHKLDELALCARDAAGRLTALPVDAALRNLDGAWDDVYASRPRGSRRLRALPEA